MAPYISSLTNWDALLQEDYVTDGIREAVNTATPFMDELDRSSTTDTSGRQRVAAVQVGLSQGQGARLENRPMPQYGAGEYKDCITKAVYNYAPFKVTGPAQEFGSKKAFADFAMKIMKDTRAGFRLFTGRQCWGDGQGILALINNGAGYAAGSLTFTVDSPYGVLWGSLATFTTMLLKRQMPIQFGTEDNGGNGYTVGTVSGLTFTITTPLANAIVDNTPITNLGSANAEIEGILKFAGTANFMATLGLGPIYHNIDRQAVPEWEGNVVNIGAALSLDAIRAVRSAVYKRTDEETSNVLIGSTEFYDAYEKLLTPAVRLVPLELKGGRKYLEHDGLRITRDSRAPVRAFFLLDTTHLKWMQTRDPHWMTDGAGGVMRVIAGLDAMEALMRWYANIDTEEPRRMAIGYNVTMT